MEEVLLIAGVLRDVAEGFVAGVVALMLLVALLSFLELLAAGLAFVHRLVRRRLGSARAPARVEHAWVVRPSLSLSLLARLEPGGRLAPSVQITGWGEIEQAWIRLELVDRQGALRHVARCPFEGEAIGSELKLPAFNPPEGATAEIVLGWHWDVVIESGKGELARWREHPRPAALINAEAELV